MTRLRSTRTRRIRLAGALAQCAALLLAGWLVKFGSAYSLNRDQASASHLRLTPPSPETTLEEAYFQFDIPPYPDTFVFLLIDPGLIEQARAMLSGKSPPRHILGVIVKGAADYNPPWHYHLAPDTIQFFDHAVEICDASIQMVEDHLEEACGAFLPDCVWCPWNSRLLREVTPTPSPPKSIYLPLVYR